MPGAAGAMDLSAIALATADEAVIRKVAAALRLGADALVASARGTWRPRDQEPLDGLAAFTTPFGDMTVNAYVVFDATTRQAAAFDTGADADPMLQFIREKQLTLALILLTHTHTDHVFESGSIEGRHRREGMRERTRAVARRGTVR